MQPYWLLDNALLARWILKARFDECPTEDWVRSQNKHDVGRIPTRYMRACYMCECIRADAPDVFWPETLPHVLLFCSHPRLVRSRATFLSSLVAFAAEEANAPDVADDSVLLTILLMCTGNGPPGRPQLVVPEVDEQDAEALRSAPRFQRDTAASMTAVEWMQGLFADWSHAAREPRRKEPLHQTRGHRLASMVARHIKRMFEIGRAHV